MPNDSQIAVMVEVAQTGGIALNATQKSELPEVIAKGLIEPSADAVEKYKLTDKGQRVLDDRGVGANES